MNFFPKSGHYFIIFVIYKRIGETSPPASCTPEPKPSDQFFFLFKLLENTNTRSRMQNGINEKKEKFKPM